MLIDGARIEYMRNEQCKFNERKNSINFMFRDTSIFTKHFNNIFCEVFDISWSLLLTFAG